MDDNRNSQSPKLTVANQTDTFLLRQIATANAAQGAVVTVFKPLAIRLDHTLEIMKM